MIGPVKNRFAICVCGLVCVLVSVSNAIAQSSGIQWKLNKGDEFAVVLMQNSISETTVDARETTVESATTIAMDWLVTEIDSNGDATVEQSLASVKLSVTGFTRKRKGDTAAPSLAISFDTAAPAGITNESKKLMNQIQPLLGLKFDVVMSPLGEIKKVTIPAGVTEQLNKMPDTQRLRNLFSKNGLKDILGAAAIVLPEDLTVGQTWTVDSPTSTALGTFVRKRTYTFVGNRTVDGKELAEFSLAVALDPSKEAQTKTASSSLDSKLIEFIGSGTLLMDVENGFFKNSKIENRARSEKPYREKKIDTIVSNKIEMTVTKK